MDAVPTTHRVWYTIHPRSTPFKQPGKSITTTLCLLARVWDTLSSHMAVTVTFEGDMLRRSTPLTVRAITVDITGNNAPVARNQR